MRSPRHLFHCAALGAALAASACSSEDDASATGGASTATGGAGTAGDAGATGGLEGIDQGDDPPEPQGIVVTPVAETEPVRGFGDAADDPAIWVHPTDPAKSVVIGSDKTSSGGLNVYGLDGSLIQSVRIGRVNNVDLRHGFELGGEEVTLITATNRTDSSLVVYTIDPDTRELTDVAARVIETAPLNYGMCMYRAADGEVYAFVNTEEGVVQQIRLFESDGKVDGEVVREFCLDSQPEGCVADDEAGILFIGEEGYGVWKFAADVDGDAPGDTTPDCDNAIPGAIVDDVVDGELTRDVEGMGIARTDEGDFLIVSAQGAHEYVMYDLAPPHAHVMTFSIFGGGPSCIDGTEETDGLDVTGEALGDAFPGGLFVAQDGFNGDPVDKQNFKLVRFDDVLAQRYEPNTECKLSDYGGQANASLLPPGPERTPEFCDQFCGRCDECQGQPGFSEGDCLYELSKPDFDLEDCLAGCELGVVPANTSPLQDGWLEWECARLDDSL